ncbi:MAG: hypothetical protein ACRD2N_04655, partial [Vicinamibacterales bacterium]
TGPAVLGTGGSLAQARLLPAGFIVYGQSPGSVRALPVDTASLNPIGPPIPLVDSVERVRNSGGMFFAISTGGLFVYAATGEGHQLVWVDRAGAVTPISADRAAFRGPRVSPNGRVIAVAVNDETRRSDIWLYDAERGTKTRLTTSLHNLMPVWTPDGSRVTYNTADGVVELPANGGDRQVIVPRDEARKHLAAGNNPYPTSWSSDGQRLLIQGDDEDVWLFSRRDGNGLAPAIVRSSSDWGGEFSPNDRWVAFASDESGRAEVYVAPAADLGRKTVISSAGGELPRWSGDGREIYYRQGDALMAARFIETANDFRIDPPRRLFTGAFTGTGRELNFDVSRDGKRFVMVKSDEASMLRQLTLVQNWFGELKRTLK